MWNLKNLIESCNEIQSYINYKWVPARPYKVFRLKERFVSTWKVFIGKANLFLCPENQQ